MSNIIDSVQLSGVTYTLSAQTSGKTVTAGRGISVTTGDTADTVALSLAISAGTGTDSIIEGYRTTASTTNSHAEGRYTKVSGIYSHAEGSGTTASGNYGSHAEGSGSTASGASSHAEGEGTKAGGEASHAEGKGTVARGFSSHAEGGFTIANNLNEHACGRFNQSNTGDTSTFGHSGNTLFSVGNGTAENARHNALEVRQNGDIYISSGGTDILLQDNLGGGGNPTVELTQAEYDALVSAGTVSADTYYIITDASGITATTVVELTQAQYDALTTKDPTTFYVITDAQSVDMSNYYTKTEIDAMIGNIESLLAAI